jgi:predicted regulator of Ras-like GTPase activity (Roadblock/LC7/MglB family)
MGKYQKVITRMEQIVADYPYIVGWSLVSRDGASTVSQLESDINDQLVGVVAAAVLSIGDKWGEDQDDCPVEYVLMGHCDHRTIFLPAGKDGALVLLLHPQGDWNQIVAAACTLADEFGQILDTPRQA